MISDKKHARKPHNHLETLGPEHDGRRHNTPLTIVDIFVVLNPPFENFVVEITGRYSLPTRAERIACLEIVIDHQSW